MGTRAYRVSSIGPTHILPLAKRLQFFKRERSASLASARGWGAQGGVAIPFLVLFSLFAIGDRKSACIRGSKGGREDRAKRTRPERFFCVAAPVIRSSPPTRADCFSSSPRCSAAVSRRPTFSIAQSVVYLAFISISHAPLRRPPLSSIPFLRTRIRDRASDERG